MSILFLPIDLDLTDLKFQQAADSEQLISWFVAYWKTSLISRETRANTQLDRVLEQLPFEEITMLSYKLQEGTVDEHVDVHTEMNITSSELAHIRAHEPAGYRLIITGSDDALEVYNGKEWITAHTPTPCCYLINSTVGRHKVRADADRSLIYIRGILDSQAHALLIEKSLKKYGKWSISRV